MTLSQENYTEIPGMGHTAAELLAADPSPYLHPEERLARWDWAQRHIECRKKCRDKLGEGAYVCAFFLDPDQLTYRGVASGMELCSRTKGNEGPMRYPANSPLLED